MASRLNTAQLLSFQNRDSTLFSIDSRRCALNGVFQDVLYGIIQEEDGGLTRCVRVLEGPTFAVFRSRVRGKAQRDPLTILVHSLTRFLSIYTERTVFITLSHRRIIDIIKVFNTRETQTDLLTSHMLSSRLWACYIE